MSAAGSPKDRRHAWERDLLGQLWQGEVDAAVDLPRVVLEWVKNPQAVEVLIANSPERDLPEPMRKALDSSRRINWRAPGKNGVRNPFGDKNLR